MSSSSPRVSALRAWLASDVEPEPWVVETSGSSGRPKRVLLSRRAVLASVAATEERLGASGRWVLRVPETYVAGLQVICRSLLAGHDPVGPDEPWPLDHGWFVSLVPTQLHRALEADGSDLDALRRAHTVLLGGGPIDPALRERAAAAGVRVMATYGSAETAGGCVYDGVPLDGVEVARADDGRLLIRGPVLFDGYEGDPELTAETLVDGWFRTADAGEVDPVEDGGRVRVRVLGRLDDVVVSGGVNVPGPAVAARLRAHPDVAAAEVLGVPDAEWGNRLVAFIVGDTDPEALRAWVGAVHPRAWAPRQVVVVPEIPLLANGKPDRQQLLSLVRTVGSPWPT